MHSSPPPPPPTPPIPLPTPHPPTHTRPQVIKRANQNEYGLASGILSNDINFINTVSRALKAGTVWVNCYNVYESGVPFGGCWEGGWRGGRSQC